MLIVEKFYTHKAVFGTSYSQTIAFIPGMRHTGTILMSGDGICGYVSVWVRVSQEDIRIDAYTG